MPSGVPRGADMPSPKAIDYRPALYAIRNAINYNTLVQLEGMLNMANNFEGLVAAIGEVEAGIAEVVAAINNPAVDNNDQEVIDGLTARLTGLVPVLDAAEATENAEDGVVGDGGPEPETPAE